MGCTPQTLASLNAKRFVHVVAPRSNLSRREYFGFPLSNLIPLRKNKLNWRWNYRDKDWHDNSLGSRKLKVKLWGIHPILFQNFFRCRCWMSFIRLLDLRHSTVFSKSSRHRPESLAKDSTIFGSRILCPLCTLKFERMYSSFATSSCSFTLFAV